MQPAGTGRPCQGGILIKHGMQQETGAHIAYLLRQNRHHRPTAHGSVPRRSHFGAFTIAIRQRNRPHSIRGRRVWKIPLNFTFCRKEHRGADQGRGGNAELLLRAMVSSRLCHRTRSATGAWTPLPHHWYRTPVGEVLSEVEQGKLPACATGRFTFVAADSELKLHTYHAGRRCGSR